MAKRKAHEWWIDTWTVADAPSDAPSHCRAFYGSYRRERILRSLAEEIRRNSIRKAMIFRGNREAAWAEKVAGGAVQLTVLPAFFEGYPVPVED